MSEVRVAGAETVPLHEYARQRPEVAAGVFEAVDRAVQELLPGSDYHERYASLTDNGLAIVLAEDRGQGAYNPLENGDSGEHSVFEEDLSLLLSNKHKIPESVTWKWKDADDEVLSATDGVPLQTKLRGRFVVMATSKVHNLDNDVSKSTSHEQLGPRTGEKGKVGYAGGKRLGLLDKTLGAASGAWHLQDHILISEYTHLLSLARDHKLAGVTEDDIEALAEIALADLREQFDALGEILNQIGKKPTELTGEEEAEIIDLIEHSYLEKIPVTV